MTTFGQTGEKSVAMKKFLFSTKVHGIDLSLLTLRLVFGAGMAFGHGYDKLIHFSEKSGSFPSVFGLGSEVSLGLAVFSEFFCAILLVVGFATRAVLIPLIITFMVAVFDIHGDDEFGAMEKALLYLTGYTTLLILGPGKLSVDRLLK